MRRKTNFNDVKEAIYLGRWKLIGLLLAVVGLCFAIAGYFLFLMGGDYRIVYTCYGIVVALLLLACSYGGMKIKDVLFGKMRRD
ncbi:hypothetical protein GCM10011491_41420 [Brucella endophytica]|uniref:Uncharacterized protein n=1 Tax=Brucella endophytica TaxID=1963359 RepID=A0A916SPE8_9HYPH|nr:hypothetical protein [Brucella endophytica]GGB09173.1 hypothetical protein GCM10011491_41420 [Brucella endophytica]